MTDDRKTVLGVLKAATAFLDSAGVHEARASCELLMAQLLKCKVLELYFRLDELLDEKRLAAMRRGAKRLAAGEPVQYILGHWDFMEHRFRVDARALIPRPETEILVQQVLECEPLWAADRPAVVEIGTGCGCIAVCLALARSRGRYLALDASPQALELAAENAAALNVSDRITFSDKDLSDLIEPGTIDALVSNPPYVATEDYEQLPRHIKAYEPRMALDGGPDGLTMITRVIEDGAAVLKDGGFIFLEIDSRQAGAVSRMLEEAGFHAITIRPDLAGRDRIASARMGGG